MPWQSPLAWCQKCFLPANAGERVFAYGEAYHRECLPDFVRSVLLDIPPDQPDHLEQLIKDVDEEYRRQLYFLRALMKEATRSGKRNDLNGAYESLEQPILIEDDPIVFDEEPSIVDTDEEPVIDDDAAIVIDDVDQPIVIDDDEVVIKAPNAGSSQNPIVIDP